MHPLIRRAGGARALIHKSRPARTVWFGDDLLQAECDAIVLKLHELDDQCSEEPIWVRINSNGGNHEGAMRIFDTLRLIRAPSIGVLLGKAYSSAAFIMQGMTVRIGAKNARFHFHNPTYEPRPLITPDTNLKVLTASFRAHIKNLNFARRRYVEEISSRSGLRPSKVRGFLLDERFILAPEAKRLGLLDAVI